MAGEVGGMQLVAADLITGLANRSLYSTRFGLSLVSHIPPIRLDHCCHGAWMGPASSLCRAARGVGLGNAGTVV